jgi:signal peptidase I
MKIPLLYFSQVALKRIPQKKKWNKWVKAFLIFFIAVVFIRLFIFDIYQVNSNSMEESLFSGNVILVNKLKYPPQRNDVIIFDLLNSDKTLVKRCIGLPGDTLQIAHNILYINHTIQAAPAQVKFSYCIKTRNKYFKPDSLEVFGISAKNFLWQEGEYVHVSMTRKFAAEMQKEQTVDSISIDDFLPGAKGPLLFSSSADWKPTRENYGPIIIPKKGKSIPITSENLHIYVKVIKDYERNDIEFRDGKTFINGKQAASYTFKNNYYFVMGDNRYHSNDSIFWGFLPESFIIGNVAGILY